MPVKRRKKEHRLKKELSYGQMEKAVEERDKNKNKVMEEDELLSWGLKDVVYLEIKGMRKERNV